MSVPPTLSLLIAILGDYSQVRRHAVRFIQELAKSGIEYEPIEIVLLVHGEVWRRELPLPSLARSGTVIKVIEDPEELPAVLFNHGAKIATGDFIAFAWPGMDFETCLASALRLAKVVAELPHPAFLAGRPVRDNGQQVDLRSWILPAPDEIPGYQGGWLEMFDYVPMECTAISREYFLGQGGFSCCPLLQRGFWWEFTIRVGRTHRIDPIDLAQKPGRWSWWDFPLGNELPLSGDLVARRAVRRTGTAKALGLVADYGNVETFAKDLPATARQRLRHLIDYWIPEGTVCPISPGPLPQTGQSSQDDAPLRVVVLGGLNEPAHNQLCFYNFFALLEQQGVLTWRAILDSAANHSDLGKADLVIFSRSRTEWTCRLMDYCVKQQIPTVYMLDDNWISIGREWPEYASMFLPGAEPYEHFMYCLQRANRVLTYNPTLAEDLRPYSRRLDLLPNNIDLTLFPESDGATGKRPRVGYAGSLRREDSAFTALLDLAGTRDDFDIFVMSASLPEPLRSLPRHRLVHQPYVFGYRRYAQVLCEARPDILLGPLSNTRSDASKCPNKYLEISAVGAAGIYSRTAPYDRFIRDRDNGLLVDNVVMQWKSAIAELLDNPQLRKHIVQAAGRDVRAHFSTPVVLPEFLTFLKEAAANRRK